jgi:hypothetical protein
VRNDGFRRPNEYFPTYRGCPGSQAEWENALRHSKQHLLATTRSPSTPLDPDHILQHLTRAAAQDKAYAWWSAHLYATLHPDLADMPARLTEHMNRDKENT